MPNQFEIGVLFRITPEQGRSVLRTYQARFSKNYASRLTAAAAKATPQQKSQSGTPVYVFSFNDPAVLDFTVDRLRRRGLTKSVAVDRTALTVTVDRGERDRFGKDAKDALK